MVILQCTLREAEFHPTTVARSTVMSSGFPPEN